MPKNKYSIDEVLEKFSEHTILQIKEANIWFKNKTIIEV